MMTHPDQAAGHPYAAGGDESADSSSSAVEGLLAGRSGAAGVRRFLADSEAAARRAISAAISAGQPITEIQVERVKLSPGRRLTVSYRAAGPGGASGQPVIGWLPAEVGWTAAAPWITARVSPDDAAFPSLVRLTEPGYASSLLSRAGIANRGCRIDSIRYRPGQRHVLSYRPPGSAGGAIVKLKADVAAAHAFAVGSAFAQWSRRSGAGGATVEPLLLSQDDEAVLTRMVAGAPLSHNLGERGALDDLVTAGRWFRALHDDPPDLSRLDLDEKTFAKVVRATLRSGRVFVAFTAGGSERLAAFADATQRLAGATAVEPAVVVHGDAKADHLWFGPGGLTVIDIESCGQAEPAFEMGKLLADIDFHLVVDPARRRAARAALLEGYGHPTGHWPRAQLYEAVALARIAFHRVSLIDPAWESRTNALLDLADELVRTATARHPAPGAA